MFESFVIMSGDPSPSSGNLVSDPSPSSGKCVACEGHKKPMSKFCKVHKPIYEKMKEQAHKHGELDDFNRMSSDEAQCREAMRIFMMTMRSKTTKKKKEKKASV